MKSRVDFCHVAREVCLGAGEELANADCVKVAHNFVFWFSDLLLTLCLEVQDKMKVEVNARRPGKKVGSWFSCEFHFTPGLFCEVIQVYECVINLKLVLHSVDILSNPNLLPSELMLRKMYVL